MRWGIALGLSGLPLGDYGDLSAAAERAGADLLCVGELQHDSFVAATVLASATTTARVMTAVTTWSRPPVWTAMAAMSVDEVSGGRFVLGLGTMPPRWSLDYAGVPPEQPLARMREYLGVVRGAFAAHSGSHLSAPGPHYPVSGWTRPAPPTREHVPVHLAVTRPGLARLAGNHADGALANVVVPVPWLRSRLLPALDEGAGAREGRGRLEVGAMVRVCLHDGSSSGRSGAYERLRRSLALYADVPYFHEIAAACGVDAGSLSRGDLDLFGVVGTVQDAAEAFEAYGALVDWVELVPPSSLAGAELREEYAALLELLAHLRQRDVRPRDVTGTGQLEY